MFQSLDINFYFLFFLLSFLIAFFLVKFSNKLFSGLLIDKDFSKPQAFHKKAIARLGGFIIMLLFGIFILSYFSILNIFLTDYLTLAFLFFTLGFLDDLKIKIDPNIRLVLMLLILIFFINFFSIEINRTGLAFLNYWLENNIFQVFFVILCFLFIVNGSNLVDGFNGLLAIHFLVINVIYLLINLDNQNLNLAIILSGQIIIVLSFLFFNFPKSQIFLGDSGSYLLGSLLALNTIKTYELNILISPFFFACILFYLFFEVFFSFLRKAISKKSPLNADKKNLHMLLFNWLIKSKKIKEHNYLTSILVNFSYIILILPVVLLKDNGLFCRYWFFLLIILYLFFYSRLYSFSKK
ncbi:MAG: glycosyltransferase [Pelagibacteraceae bacterium]